MFTAAGRPCAASQAYPWSSDCANVGSRRVSSLSPRERRRAVFMPWPSLLKRMDTCTLEVEAPAVCGEYT
jgi:hypothetical protein